MRFMEAHLCLCTPAARTLAHIVKTVAADLVLLDGFMREACSCQGCVCDLLCYNACLQNLPETQ
jgi:hypothetical protein